MTLDIGLDLFPLLAATLAAVACALLGNFLLLRKLSLMGDAISHAVLPGLVIAFLLATTRSPFAMMLGAAIAGLATVILVELVKKLGRVEPGAAMGVVFSILFASGVLLLEEAAIRHVDFDADCMLHGQLEILAWYDAPPTVRQLIAWSTIEHIPRQVITLAIAVMLAAVFVAVFLKELRIAAFDPALATSQGFSATTLHYLLMIFVAIATVASFEAVGSILVIAMLICPAATARLLTDRLLPQVLLSVAIAIATAVLGYIAAIAVPGFFDKDAVNAAGSITVASGLFLAIAIIASPSHGLITRAIRRHRLATRVATDDLLAALFRAAEQGHDVLTIEHVKRSLPARPIDRAITRALAHALITREDQGIALSSQGHAAATEIVRKHRLWERYLVDQAGFAPDHVHPSAEAFEHLATRPPIGPDTDPHGRHIP